MNNLKLITIDECHIIQLRSRYNFQIAFYRDLFRVKLYGPAQVCYTATFGNGAAIPVQDDTNLLGATHKLRIFQFYTALFDLALG